MVRESGLKSQSRSYFGMQLAHLGVAVFIIGVTLVKGYETERDVRMAPGDTVAAGGYTFRDIDGKPTRWGVWSPERLNGDPNTPGIQLRPGDFIDAQKSFFLQHGADGPSYEAHTPGGPTLRGP